MRKVIATLKNNLILMEQKDQIISFETVHCRRNISNDCFTYTNAWYTPSNNMIFK